MNTYDVLSTKDGTVIVEDVFLAIAAHVAQRYSNTIVFCPQTGIVYDRDGYRIAPLDTPSPTR